MLGPPVCVECKKVYTLKEYINEQGGECVKWYCPICLKDDTKHFALTISDKLFDELFPEESK